VQKAGHHFEDQMALAARGKGGLGMHRVVENVSWASSSGSFRNVIKVAREFKDESVEVDTAQLRASIEEAHRQGTCKPCPFYLRKSGCLSGDACVNCHQDHPKKQENRGVDDSARTASSTNRNSGKPKIVMRL